MSTLGNAHIDLTGDDRQLQSTLKRVRPSLEKIQKRMESVGRAARKMLLVGGGAIAGFIKLASDAQETANRFEQVFGQQADAAEEFADRLGEAVNRATLGLKDSLTTFQSFFVGLGFGGERARELSQRLTRLAVDFASFNNMSDSEAVERFISAMSGSAEVMDRFGINLRASALEQELLSQGIEKTAAEATEQEKAIARLNIIMQAMTDQGAVGDAVRTSEEFANQLRGLTGQAKAAGAAIGRAFLPAATALLQELVPLAKATGEWAKENKNAIVQLTGLAAVIGAVLVVLPKLMGALTLLATHPVIAMLGVIAVGVAGMVAQLNDGKVAGLDLNAALARLAATMGIVSDAAFNLADAQDRASAARERFLKLRQLRSEAQVPKQELAALEEMIKLQEKRVKMQREIVRQEVMLDQDSSLDQMKQRAEILEGQIKRARERGASTTGFEGGFLSVAEARRRALAMRKEIGAIEAEIEARMGRAASPMEKVLEDLKSDAEQLRESLKPEEEPARSFFDTIRDGFDQLTEHAPTVWERFTEAMRQAQREMAEARGEFRDELELFGAGAQESALIRLERRRDELRQQAKELGILTDEVKAEIQSRFERERQRIVGDDAPADTSAGGEGRQQERRVSARIESGVDMFRRIAAAAATPRDLEERTATATERTAEGVERIATTMRDQEQRARQAMGGGGGDGSGGGAGGRGGMDGNNVKTLLERAVKAGNEQVKILTNIERAIPNLGTYTA